MKIQVTKTGCAPITAVDLETGKNISARHVEVSAFSDFVIHRESTDDGVKVIVSGDARRIEFRDGSVWTAPEAQPTTEVIISSDEGGAPCEPKGFWSRLVGF